MIVYTLETGIYIMILHAIALYLTLYQGSFQGVFARHPSLGHNSASSAAESSLIETIGMVTVSAFQLLRAMALLTLSTTILVYHRAGDANIYRVLYSNRPLCVFAPRHVWRSQLIEFASTCSVSELLAHLVRAIFPARRPVC